MEPPVDSDTIDEVADILKDHRGEAEAISSAQINNQVQLDKSDTRSRTREVIKYLLFERGMAIGATNQGYYLIKTSEELLDNIERLDDRIFGLELRKKGIRMAYHGDALADSDIGEFLD